MKKNKTIEAIVEHYNDNLLLGTIYNSLKVQAAKFNCNNLSKYLKMLSDDKLTIHKDLITDYLISVGNDLDASISCYSQDYTKALNSPKEIIEFVYSKELEIRGKINKICELSLEEKDFESFNFIQWFVKDGLKDFNEIEYIKGLFELTDNMLEIDNNIKDILEE